MAVRDENSIIPYIPPIEEIQDEEGLMDRLLSMLGGIGQSELGAIWADPTIEEILRANTIRMNPDAPFDIEQATGINVTALGQMVAALENATAEAQNIANTLFEDPSALSDMEDPGSLVTTVLESSALGFLGPPGASPVATTPQGIVLPGGAGVTIDFEEIGSISDINLETIFEKLKGYIPGISLPSWLPSAGVIFIPELQDKIRQVDNAIGGVIDSVSGALEGEEDVQSVLDAIGGVIGEVFDAVVYDEEEGEEGIIENAVGSIFDAIKGVLEGTADSSTIGTIVSGVATSVLGTSLPSWLPGVLTTVFTPGSPVISTVRQVLSDMGITLPFTEEETEQDPSLMFTHRGDNYFVNSESNEYFQLEEDPELEFDVDGLYSRADLEETGLETLESGTYQSLLDDYSFYALTEDIYQYPIKELARRFEEEGGIIPGDFDLMDDESQYDFFINEFFNPTPIKQAPIRNDDPDPDPDPDSDENNDEDTTTTGDEDEDTTEDDEDDSIIEDLFSDVIGQTETNILQAIADAGYATPQDVIDAISEAGLLTAENLATTLANAGFATPEDIGTALANAGFATPQDIADALSAAGFATPEDLATALSNAGYATPEDLVRALSETGFATPEDIATAITNAGLATPQDLADAFDAAGLATPQDVIDAISAAGLATPQDVRDALEAFGFTDAQLQQIAGALPEGLTTDQLNTALNDALAGIATGENLDTVTTTITDAISGLNFATAEDVRTALAEFGFTEEQLQQIVGALPEGLSLSDLDTALEGIVVGADLDTAVTTITDAISGLSFATAEDVRTALSEFNFSEDQLNQIINALPEGLNISDLTDALAGVVVGDDLNAAVTTITDAISGLSIASPDDIRSILANYGFTDAQLEQIVGALPEGLSLSDVTTALDTALSGIATGTDLNTATQTITNAIGGLAFATAEDVRTALSEFGFTDAQLEQIVNALPEGLSLTDVEGALSTALTGIATGEDLTSAVTTITDAFSSLDVASAQDVRDALSQFNFSEEQLNQIVNALPEGLSTTDLENALEGVVVGADLDTAVTTITNAISGLDIASAQDVRDALAEFNFTEDQLNQIINALPEGLSTDDLTTALSDVVVGDDLNAAVTTITTAIGGLDIASPDDIRNILANYGFTDAQLEQIAGALPEGLSLADLTSTLETAMSGIALGTDIDSATNTITDAISGLAFATPEDVANALTQFGFTEDQLNQIASVIPEGLSISDLNDALGNALSGIALGSDLETATTTITDAIGGLNFATADDVANALANFGFSEDQLNQISGAIPQGLTLNQLNDALTGAVSGLALGTDLDAATTTITDAIGGLNFATAQDIQDALMGFNFTESQLNQISNLLPDDLTQTQVQDLLTTSLSGVSTQENVDEAFATLTINLTTNLGELAEGQEEILTGQEGLFGGQQDILTGVGEESQRLEDIIMSSTGLLAAIGAGGLGGGAPARPRPEPYRPYMEKLDYAPGMVEALKPQQQVDYNKEVDRLLTMGMGGRKQGMLV